MTQLDQLNPVQREAVLATSGPVLVLAGAGSGKTRVLTHKVAHLVEGVGVHPARVLAFTFTNKAAAEMRSRIEGLLGSGAGGLWMGTFHATCLRLLRMNARHAGLTPGFSIFDRDDSLRAVKKVIRESHLSDDEFRPRAMLERISSAKSAMLTPDQLAETALSRFHELQATIYAAYEEELARQNALDFDDLLSRALTLLSAAEDVARDLSERFQHILVDEYQDTNTVQFELIRRLADRHKNLTVVGDDDQSIYGWRGADLRNILDFEKHFPDAKVLRLEQNYRSTSRILDAANAVVANNEGRKEKALWTENPEGERLVTTMVPDEEREAEDVMRTILALRGDGVRLWDVAVLYRTNAQSRPFEEVCLRHRIGYRIVGGVQFFARQEVKDALAYLRLAVNPRDEVAFQRAVAVPKRGVGKVSVEKLLEFARAADLDLVTAARQARSIPGITPRAAGELVRFGDLLAEVAALPEEEPADRVMARVLEESGMLEALESAGSDGASRRENLDELVAGARAHAARAENPGFRAYVEDVSLRTDLDGWDPEDDTLTLMTVHNAKGLEFDVVFVAGLEEGLFPHSSSLEEASGLEEERRLFYVALTRARLRCFLSASRDRRRMNRFEAARPSRFLAEVPDHLVETRDPWGLGLRSGRYGGTQTVRRTRGSGAASPGASYGAGSGVGYEEPVFDADSMPATEHVGRLVAHKKFGRGVVLSQEGSGEQAKCEVRFIGDLRKKVRADFLEFLEEGYDA